MNFKPGEVNAIVNDVILGNVSAVKAIAELKSRGMSDYMAFMNVFVSLGGGDIIMTDKDGVQRYHHSGKPVEEVRRAMGDVREFSDEDEDDEEEQNDNGENRSEPVL